MPIDIVKWKKFFHQHKKPTEENRAELAGCFEVVDKRYCEFIVREIPESESYKKFDIQDLLYYTEFHMHIGGDATGEDSEALTEMVQATCDNAIDFIDDICGPLGEVSETDDYGFRLYIQKQGFEVFVSPLFLLCCLTDQEFSSILHYDPDVYFDIKNELNELLDYNYEGLDEPTYERQNRILALLNFCFYGGFDRKIGPNEPCPCGNGWKYKKCCKRKIEKVWWGDCAFNV